jgi:glycosyltransferase involved in cell wall biosynthesis
VTAKTSTTRRVCVVAPMPPPYGGMSLQAERLILRLAEEGICVEVVPTNLQPPRILMWIQKVPGLRTLIRELQYLAALARHLHDCETFHHFSASGLYFFAHSAPLLLAGAWSKKRVLLNYRGGKADDFLKTWGWIAVPLIRLATSICVPSKFLQQVFAKYGLTSTLLPNIAQTEMFPWNERESFAPSLLVTRHLDPMYNTECLLRAFRIIKDRFPEAVLSVVGEGSEEIRLRNLVGQWQLSGVRFLGSVAHRDLPTLYASHNIYVNSSNVDNFPGALVEAACSGLPIVTTGAGGIPWMIRNRENGIVVNLNDEKALAAGVVEIVEHSEFGRNLARNARTWAEQFAWKNVFPKLLSAYGHDLTAREPSFAGVEVVH